MSKIDSDAGKRGAIVNNKQNSVRADLYVVLVDCANPCA